MKKKEKNMFSKPGKKIDFFSSGCVLLDCVLSRGRGWAERRIAHITGESGTGKTELGEEAAIEFLTKYNTGKINYHEIESAFDYDYAESIDFPLDMVTFVKGEKGSPINSVEGLRNSIRKEMNLSVEKGIPILYILDSLDSIDSDSDDYGKKQRDLASLFRSIAADMEDTNFTLIIIGQTRVNMKDLFQKYYITGGEALKFYSTQRLLLTPKGKISTKHKGIERTKGTITKAKSFKNKVGPWPRECVFEILDYFGIDDVGSSLKWLNTNEDAVDIFKELDIFERIRLKDTEEVSPQRLGNLINELNSTPNWDLIKSIHAKVIERWNQIEEAIAPTRRKREGR